MKIIHVPDYETLSRKTAQLIAAQVLCKPDSLLGLGHRIISGRRLPVFGSMAYFW